MTEMELKLILLRYNLLAKEESAAAYDYMRAGQTVDYENKWFRCLNEMTRIEDDLRRYGYKFTSTGSKTVDRVCYNVYKIVPIDSIN